MDRNQLFEDSLKVYADFGELDLKHLKQIGISIGNDPAAAKKMYLDYLNKNNKNEVVIEGQSIKVKFNSTLFLKFLNLVDICYSEILPVGSVVEADLEKFPVGFKNLYELNDEPALFIISGRKVPAHDIETPFYVDYTTRLFPLGETDFVPAFQLSNMMIKQVVHRGFSNDHEVEFTEKIRQDMINAKVRSVGFLAEDEFKFLETMISSAANVELDGDS